MKKNPIMNLLRAILNLPKTISNLYDSWIANGDRKDLKKACLKLKKYSEDVLNRQLDEGSFAEVRALYIERKAHGLRIRQLILSGLETLASVLVIYLYIVENKNDLFLKLAEDVTSFVALFMGGFFLPRVLKLMLSSKSKRHRAVESLNYCLYKNLMNNP